jgi:hypothetical protein
MKITQEHFDEAKQEALECFLKNKKVISPIF